MRYIVFLASFAILIASKRNAVALEPLIWRSLVIKHNNITIYIDTFQKHTVFDRIWNQLLINLFRKRKQQGRFEDVHKKQEFQSSSEKCHL